MFNMVEEIKQIIKEGGLSQMPEKNVGVETPVDAETPVVEVPVVENPVVEASGEFKKEEEKNCGQQRKRYNR